MPNELFEMGLTFLTWPRPVTSCAPILNMLFKITIVKVFCGYFLKLLNFKLCSVGVQ